MNVRKNSFGWMAESYVYLDDETRISITTMKRSSGVISTMVCGSRKENSMWYFTVCQDYTMVWGVADTTRATEKAITEQQAKVMLRIDEIKAEAQRFYENMRETT